MTDIVSFDDYVYEPVDLCSCYEPFYDPPPEQVEEWQKLREQANPFRCSIRKKIGNTWYLIETVCDGRESLKDKVKRLIFSVGR